MLPTGNAAEKLRDEVSDGKPKAHSPKIMLRGILSQEMQERPQATGEVLGFCGGLWLFPRLPQIFARRVVRCCISWELPLVHRAAPCRSRDFSRSIRAVKQPVVKIREAATRGLLRKALHEQLQKR
eukprot:scaffold726_cov262-Pinguiococcus_pyrenoidosus.AAC.23